MKHAKKIRPMREPDSNACTAAETLVSFLQNSARRAITSPWRRRLPLYGVFNGDVLMSWGFGRHAAKWAGRAAGNCLDCELRAQYLGSFTP